MSKKEISRAGYPAREISVTGAYYESYFFVFGDGVVAPDGFTADRLGVTHSEVVSMTCFQAFDVAGSAAPAAGIFQRVASGAAVFHVDPVSGDAALA